MVWRRQTVFPLKVYYLTWSSQHTSGTPPHPRARHCGQLFQVVDKIKMILNKRAPKLLPLESNKTELGKKFSQTLKIVSQKTIHTSDNWLSLLSYHAFS